MSAPYNDLLSKLEAAIAVELDALALTGTLGTESVNVAVRTGLDDDETLLPRITAQADESTEEVVKDTGNYRVRCFVHVHSQSTDETLLIHRARVATVLDAMQQSDIATQLTANAEDFHCFDVRFIGPQHEPNGNKFHTALEFEAVCCPSDLS